MCLPSLCNRSFPLTSQIWKSLNGVVKYEMDFQWREWAFSFRVLVSSKETPVI